MVYKNAPNIHESAPNIQKCIINHVDSGFIVELSMEN